MPWRSRPRRWRVTSPADVAQTWIPFLDERLRRAVQSITGGEEPAHDPLRGLYISDEQAVHLASSPGPPGVDARLAAAAALLGLDALDAAVLAVCIAPELHPRYGRLYAYLQDDITRRLASPRLAADLLAGDGVGRDAVLASFGPTSALARAGAIRMPPVDATTTLADRPVKVADR